MSDNKDRVTSPGMRFQAPQAEKVKSSDLEAERRRGGWLWLVISDPATHVLEVWPSIRAIPFHLGAGASTGKKVLPGSGRICSPSTRGFESTEPQENETAEPQLLKGTNLNCDSESSVLLQTKVYNEHRFSDQKPRKMKLLILNFQGLLGTSSSQPQRGQMLHKHGKPG